MWIVLGDTRVNTTYAGGRLQVVKAFSEYLIAGCINRLYRADLLIPDCELPDDECEGFCECHGARKESQFP